MSPVSSPALARLLNVAGIPHAFRLALLHGCYVFGFAVPVTVIPLLALELLGDPQRVSMLFLATGLVGLSGALSVPVLVETIGRRRVAMLGAASLVAAAALMPQDSAASLVAGAALYTFGAFCMTVSLNVAIMDRIPRSAFSRFEPLRMACIGAGFTVGPWLGVQLDAVGGLWLPFAVMAATAVGVCTYGIGAGLFGDRSATVRDRTNPLRHVPRFARQPRLRLAWLLAAARSAWWSVFFVYGPIYCVRNGFSDQDAGLVVSLGTAAVMLAPFWGRLFRPVGLKGLLATGFLATGAATLLMAAANGRPTLAIGLLLVAALCASWIDAAGSALFLRAVHPHERAAMASVFSTFRDAGRMGSQGVFAVLLLAFPLNAVFVATGLATLGMAWYTRYIPRRY